MKYALVACLVVAAAAATPLRARAEEPSDQKITRILTILEGMDKRLNSHEASINDLKVRVSEIEGRLSTLEGKYGSGSYATSRSTPPATRSGYRSQYGSSPSRVIYVPASGSYYSYVGNYRITWNPIFDSDDVDLSSLIDR